MFAMLPGMSDLFDQLNNREETLAVWAVIFLGWMLTQAEIRGSLARRARLRCREARDDRGALLLGR